MDDSRRLWTKCSELLQTQVPESTWRTWFEPARPVPDDSGLTLAVPSTLVKERIESRFLPLIENAVFRVTGTSTPIHLEVRSLTDEPTEEAAAETWGAGGELEGTAELPVPRSWDASDDEAPETPGTRELNGKELNGRDGATTLEVRANRTANRTANGTANGTGDSPPTDDANRVADRYTFDAFVIGSSNRFAHAAALSVAETPAKAYNPLFIHGEAGLGKTHLLHAIGNYVREHYPSFNVTYVSTETFMNEFVDAIRRNATADFKRRYRECDVLLVDDIQFMENKESLQEEFFHTFNSLHGASKQIVITSDRPPKAIATLENRLRSRFLSGLITDVQPPDLETRLAILRKKASSERITMRDEVMEFIATHVTDNIRELEGAFIRASAFASLSGTPLDRQLAEQVLSDIVTANQTHSVTPAIIIELTSKAFGFSTEELCSASRRRPLTTARQIAMYLCRELTDYSYPAIGAEFGGRDHTTVIHAVSKVSAMMMQRKQIYEQVNGLIHQVKSGG